MVGNHQKIERTVKLGLNSAGRYNFFAARKPKCVLWPKPHAKAKGIDRVGGMQMGVAPENPFGISRCNDFFFTNPASWLNLFAADYCNRNHASDDPFFHDYSPPISCAILS